MHVVSKLNFQKHNFSHISKQILICTFLYYSHIDSIDEPSKLSATGYHCPQCASKYCELPVECIVCGLTLVSAPHLARSYHHLFPVHHFKELTFSGQAEICFACQKLFNETHDKNVYECDTCSQIFCIDCDIFMHDTLHTCVGCTTIPLAAQSVHQRQAVAPASLLQAHSVF